MPAVLLGVSVAAGAVWTAAPAAAHTDVVATSPRAGQVLTDAPEEVSVAFDDPVDLRTARVKVVAPDGAPVAGVGPPGHADGRDSTLAASVPAVLGDGTHTVVWRVASGDGHPIQGSFTNSVGVAGPTAAPGGLDAADPGLRLASGMARWLSFAGLAIAVGAAYFLAVCWPGGAASARARRLVWAGGGALAVGTLAGLALYAPYVGGGTLADAADPGGLPFTLGTRTGVLLAARLVLLAVLGAAAARALRRWAATPDPGLAGAKARAAGVLGAGAALAATWSLATHSAAGPGLAVAVPVDVAHLLAMSVWLGGLVVLLGALLPARDPVALRRAVPLFSTTAAFCVAALVITGCYQAWRQVGSPAALRDTTYGGILLAKVAGVVVLVVLGAMASKARERGTSERGERPEHKARTWAGRVGSRAAVGAGRAVGVGRRPRPGSTALLEPPPPDPPADGIGRFRRTVVVESVLGVVVLGLTASLVSVQPARTAHAARAAAANVSALVGATPVAEAVDGMALGLGLRPDGMTAEPDTSTASGWVTATVSPAANGLPNEVHVSVVDTKDRPIELKGIGIDLRRRGGSEPSRQYPLLPSGPGHFFASFVLPAAGSWDLGLLVVARDGTADLVLLPVEAHLPER